MSELLDEDELMSQLRKCPEWEEDGDSIVRSFEFEEFMEAIDFVNDVAELAEDSQHHPEFQISFNKVVVSLTTDDEGGVTALDIEMAQRIDNLVD
ncbi:MAG: 4a-hydroxytetrahydrobiopterin dehydratase [Verrucomicrobiales bacterium]